MSTTQKIRSIGFGLALCLIVVPGCGAEESREQFPPITYEPTVEQNHILDGVFTTEPFETDEEG